MMGIENSCMNVDSLNTVANNFQEYKMYLLWLCYK